MESNDSEEIEKNEQTKIARDTVIPRDQGINGKNRLQVDIII